MALVERNAAWSGPLSFLLACSASIVGPNFLVPVGTILIAAGTVVGAQLVSWTIVVWAAAGAICGCALSYWAGRWLGPHVEQLEFLRRRAELVERARALCRDYGARAVFVGYFAGPLRALVMTSAGGLQMSAVRFHLVNVLAAPVWAVVTVGQGAMIGAAFGADHPWFLVSPVLAPLVATGLAASGSFAWRQVRNRHGDSKRMRS